MKQILIFAALSFFVNVASAADVTAPALYFDVNQRVDKRVADLIARLTLKEKAALLDQVGPAIGRFNIRSDQWNQHPNGVRWDKPTTQFPICRAMSATRDTNLVHEAASDLSDEARAICNGCIFFECAA